MRAEEGGKILNQSDDYIKEKKETVVSDYFGQEGEH